MKGASTAHAALRLGARCGRRVGDLTLTLPGDQTRYLWPAAWDRAVADLAALEVSGVEVTSEFHPVGGAA